MRGVKVAQVEFLLVGDHAEANSGKLNMLGAGWTDLWRAQAPESTGPPITHFGIAIGVLVPWADTNQPHHLTVQIEDEDGQVLGEPIEADIEMGRPPGLPEGADQRAILAINADIQFPLAGGYRVIARLSDDEFKTVSFRVHDQAASG